MRTCPPMLAGLLLLRLAAPVSAHAGPPYPIAVDEKASFGLVSVWADPDVGTGTFLVFLDALPGQSLPEDTAVRIFVQPADGRLPEAAFEARRVARREGQEFDAYVDFATQEHWRARIVVSSGAGSGEVVREVDVTPPGLGRWDVLWFAFPFLAVAVLFVRAAMLKRAASGAPAAGRPPAAGR